MYRLKHGVFLFISCLLCMVFLSGCSKRQAYIPPAEYPGSVYDILANHQSTLERYVQLLKEHPEAFVVYDSPYSRHKDIPLDDVYGMKHLECFNASDAEFLKKCSSVMCMRSLTFHEAFVDTYPVYEFFFQTSFHPYTLYWIELDEDDADKEEKLAGTIEHLLSSHNDSCSIVKGSGTNWYILNVDEGQNEINSQEVAGRA